MKKYYFLLIFVIIFSINSKVFSQDTNSIKFLPLKRGNAWYYKTTFPPPLPYPPDYYKEYIDKDTVIDGKLYFKYSKYRNSQVVFSHYIRIDSSNGNLTVYSPGDGCGSYSDDKIIDSLASSPNDQIVCSYQNIIFRKCLNAGTVSVFGFISDSKEFYHDGLFIEYVEYAKNFGVIYSCSAEPPPCTSYTSLIGCRIDDIVYGDTNLTKIRPISNTVPEKFSLSQNYPNPFNPNTIINYDIPSNVKGQMSKVRLVVYNNLGKEVVTLVNEKQSAGSYSVEFNGGNLPSGIYFYELKTENFSEIKKMILLK